MSSSNHELGHARSSKLTKRASSFLLSSERTTREVSRSTSAPDTVVPPLVEGQLLLGRYMILRKLGRGGFSDVYLVHDPELNRQVAIKRLLLTDIDPALIREEAKTLASLDHPSIVRIYDVCHDVDHGYLMIMQFVDGPGLRDVMTLALPVLRAVEIAIRVCGGLIHAHSRGIVHRDIKPSNILMSSTGDPLISDFGLALSPNGFNLGAEGGTLRYMSPEQILRETKRLGPGTDIFSTGVMLYEMLAGRPPFNGLTAEAITEATLEASPDPITLHNPQVPADLDLICRTAIRKNVNDRYHSMEAFQADLIRWHRKQLRQLDLDASADALPGTSDREAFDGFLPTSVEVLNSPHAIRQLTLRGIQPFEAADTKYFLALLPGDHAPSGLPQSVQFWKNWIESYDNSSPMRVGILYGPSGSGKTSLLKAGVIPHLAPDILPILVDCCKGDIATQLQAALQPQGPPPTPRTLTEWAMLIRDQPGLRGQCRKSVLILDQFDTWARSATAAQLSHCAAALRQCDGEQLQSLLVIGDDFWMQAVDFMHEVQCAVEQWKNVRAIELLDRHFARQLLVAIGRAYGALPPAPVMLSDAQEKFIDQAIDEMTCKGRLVPIQLALFAKCAKFQRWSPETLQYLGGIQGTLVCAIQDQFEGRSAPPMYRRVSRAAVEILNCLLPPPDQSVQDWQVRFADLDVALTKIKLQSQLHRALSILVDDLRLVVRVVADVSSKPNDSAQASKGDSFQLAHEFLAVPVANWINQVRKSNWHGRAIARLDELSSMWNRREQNRFMPTSSELIAMLMALPPANRSPLQSRFLNAAWRNSLARAGLSLIALLLVVGVTLFGLHQRNLAHLSREKHVSHVVDQCVTSAAPSGFVQRLQELDSSTALKHSQKWMTDSNPKHRTRALLINTLLTRTDALSLAMQLDQLESELGELAIQALDKCTDGRRVLNEICDNPDSSEKIRNRAALSLARLGNPGPLRTRLSFLHSPHITDNCTREAIYWALDIGAWTDWLSPAESPDMTYFGLAVLSSLPESAFPEDFPWNKIEGMCHDSHAAVQSAAAALLRQHRRSLPATPDTRPRLASGQMLVQIEPGELTVEYKQMPGSAPPIHVERSFWITSLPVSNQQFDAFRADLNTLIKPAVEHLRRPQADADPERPVTGLLFPIVLEYCNALSRAQGLEPVYELTWEATEAPSMNVSTSQTKGEGEPVCPLPNWRYRVIAQANGIRLPTSGQLIYAMAAGSSKPSTKVMNELASRRLETVTDWTSVDLFPNRFGVHFGEDDMYWVLESGSSGWACSHDGRWMVKVESQPRVPRARHLLHLVRPIPETKNEG